MLAFSLGLPIIYSMKTQDAIEYFGSKAKLAEAVGIRLPSVYEWGEVVPFARQQQIQSITKGKLKAMNWSEFLEHKQTKSQAA